MKKVNEKLRQKCLRLMCEKNLLNKGALKKLKDITGHNKNSISMALTGYRGGSGSEKILKDVKAALSKM
jgi:hypothetical protein